jgi:hypothetical protein
MRGGKKKLINAADDRKSISQAPSVAPKQSSPSTQILAAAIETNRRKQSTTKQRIDQKPPPHHAPLQTMSTFQPSALIDESPRCGGVQPYRNSKCFLTPKKRRNILVQSTSALATAEKANPFKA